MEQEGIRDAAGDRVRIPENVLQKMDRRLIGAADVQAVIRHCLDTGVSIYNEEKKTCTGHKTIGGITYWVEYRTEGGEIEVRNAYSHRMVVS